MNNGCPYCGEDCLSWVVEGKQCHDNKTAKEIFNGDKAKELYLQGADRLEYLDQYEKWQIFDHKFDRPSIFKFYDKWRIY